jgi:hypothetical protein
MTVPDETAIPPGRTKIVFLIVVALGFVVFGFCLFNLNDSRILPRHDPTFVHGVALVAMVFFWLCGLFGIRKLFDTRPGLQSTSEGIIDNSNGMAAGFVP